jgi:hypothetical protein
MEDLDVKNFEQVLRSYRFRSPNRFPPAPKIFLAHPLWQLAMAAAVLVVAGAGVWRLNRRVHFSTNLPAVHNPRPSAEEQREALTVARLTQITATNHRELDTLLIQASPRILLNVEQSRGILHALAGE